MALLVDYGTATTYCQPNYYYWRTWCDNTAATSLVKFINGGTTSAVTYGNNLKVWLDWTTPDGTAATTNYTVGALPRDARPPEQVAADNARYQEQLRVEQERIAARVAEQNAKRAIVKAKAEALLLSMLSVQQRERLQRDKFFEVIGQHTKRRYRIRHGTHGNVRLLDEQGREVTRYCAQPNGVPTEDAMLAQKLQIEHDEQAFLRIANATRVA